MQFNYFISYIYVVSFGTFLLLLGLDHTYIFLSSHGRFLLPNRVGRTKNLVKKRMVMQRMFLLSITQKLSLPIHQFFLSHRHHHIITTSTIVITKRSAVENIKPKRYIGVNK